MTDLILADLDHDTALDADATQLIQGGAFLGQDQLGHFVQGGLTVEDSSISFLSPKVFFAPTFAIAPQIQVGISEDFTSIVASQLVGRLDRFLPA